MTLSTSSSEAKRIGPAATLAIVAVLAALVGLCRVDEAYATAPNWYWRMKVEWRRAASTLLIGDSRVYRGLDPDTFSAITGHKTLNFGFSSVGFDTAYLDAVENAIDPTANSPTIVIGVTPWSLTSKAVRQNGFTDAISESRTTVVPARLHQAFDRFDRLFRPLEVGRFWQGSAAARFKNRATDSDYIQDFRTNGWVASDYRMRDPSRGVVTAKNDHANGNRISPALLRSLCDRVHRWRRMGWTILAFRPPTPRLISELTDQLSGFNEQDVSRALSQAGAAWIEVNPDGYQSYDGSHLTAQSARQLSSLIAKKIPPRD